MVGGIGLQDGNLPKIIKISPLSAQWQDTRAMKAVVGEEAGAVASWGTHWNDPGLDGESFTLEKSKGQMAWNYRVNGV